MATKRLRSLLEELEYPGIAEMGRDELCEVFGAGNRIEFLKWVAGKLNYNDLPKNDEALRLALAGFIHGQGFCGADENTKFVNSALDDKFDCTSEVKIIFCMLEYLVEKKKAEGNAAQRSGKKLSTEDLITFCQKDLGLQSAVANMTKAAREQTKDKLAGAEKDGVYRLSESDRQRVLIPEVVGGENDGFNYDRFEVALTSFAKSINSMDKPAEGADSEEKTAIGELTCFQNLVDLYSKFSANAEMIHHFMQEDFRKAETETHDASRTVETLSKLAADILKTTKEE